MRDMQIVYCKDCKFRYTQSCMANIAIYKKCKDCANSATCGGPATQYYAVCDDDFCSFGRKE